MIRAVLLLWLAALPAAAGAGPDAVLKIGARTGGGGCTAFLVAPHAALTAAHCARGPVTLLAGWHDGRARQSRGGIDPRRPALSPRIENRYRTDQVRLTVPRAFAGVAPLRPGPAPAPGSRVEIPAYPRHEAGRRTIACTVAARPGSEIVLDCPARSGMSGAPLLQGGRVVGILTNRIGRDRALATELAPDLLD